MNPINSIYKGSLALLTDLYELTMAAGYWKAGLADRESVFHLIFRTLPFKGGFAVACGLDYAAELLEKFSFSSDDIEYLQTLKGNDGKPLFQPAFLDYLRNLRFSCSVAAIPEGTLVFPQEPLVRVQGPMLQCQIIESFLINAIGFQTLVATKAARLKIAALGEPVIEFGLRRAQGIDGSITATRAAFVGGCDGTSNVLAGKVLGIPVRGTHAHSWVMTFPDEQTAFNEYVESMPNNSILLVDTYDTLQGVRHAIEAAVRLREQGHKFAGIRLDSGDLAYLSKEARRMLDDAGFTDAVIVGSNDLDEEIVASLKQQGAKINVWGVGTKLVTAYDQPALGAVYKLSAIRAADGHWQHKVKLSEQSAKASVPGILQVRRFTLHGECIGDAIYDTLTGIAEQPMIVDPQDIVRRKRIPQGAAGEDLLVPVFDNGRRVYESPSLSEMRTRTMQQLDCFHEGIKRFVNPHQYPAGLEERLFNLRTTLMLKEREANL